MAKRAHFHRHFTSVEGGTSTADATAPLDSGTTAAPLDSGTTATVGAGASTATVESGASTATVGSGATTATVGSADTSGLATSSSALAHEGVNLSGGEFGYASETPWKSGTQIGIDYEYPTNQEIDYFTAQGMNTFRLPVHAQHLLDASKADDLSIVSSLIDHAAAKGATVILDVQDFGYTATGKLIGHDAGSVTEFANEWASIAEVFKDKPNVMFDLMNEPHSQTATEWLSGANAAIQAIRDQGATQKILVPGSYWDGAHSWVSSDNDTVIGTGVHDPQNNFAFEVHQYLDPNYGGETSAVVRGTGSTLLQEATDWARANHAQLFLGEFGFASDQASMTEGKALSDFTHANADVWLGQTYWAAGPGWGDYMFSVEPLGLGTAHETDRPQLAVLTEYLI
jgi:endoglucanase